MVSEALLGFWTLAGDTDLSLTAQEGKLDKNLPDVCINLIRGAGKTLLLSRDSLNTDILH